MSSITAAQRSAAQCIRRRRRRRHLMSWLGAACSARVNPSVDAIITSDFLRHQAPPTKLTRLSSLTRPLCRSLPFIVAVIANFLPVVNYDKAAQ